MKPLHNSEITKFLERFDDFKGGEIRSLKIITPTEIELTLTAQDRAREFDWVSVVFSFSGVSDARLTDEKKITYIELDDGVTFLQADKEFAFAIGKYSTVNSLQDAQLYIISQSVKYNQESF